ncbi:MAG TPA: response regulator [Candidatus Nanopelagicaceae bacterium]|nr:response regulator [Candidatus Nanopelagicaceae bacterium]
MNRNNLSDALVLVVDDDEDIRSLISYIFEYSGCRVLTATTGDSALLLTEQYEPDLIVLDLMLPDFSGFEVVKCIRTSSVVEVNLTPVIMLSAAPQIQNADTWQADSTIEYLGKPFKPAVLLARAAAIVTGIDTRVRTNV